MSNSPIVTAPQLSDLGPLRLLYVPTAEERPAGMAVVPIRNWIATAKQSETGFDDVAYRQDQFAQLGLTQDTLTVILDDGAMTEAARVWFILQYFGLPTAVLNGGLPELGTPPTQATQGTTTPDLRPGAGEVGLIARQS